MPDRLSFVSDYMEGAHPAILRRLSETNLMKTPGYGLDAFSESARRRIRAACGTPEADIFFLAGGTQANAAVIGALLRPWQGVMAAETGHIAGHEAGAVEAGGHKVLTLPHRDGKLAAETVRACAEAWLRDENRDHIVMPGMVYISQPTELGTLYSLAELEALSGVCRTLGLPLYLDGARLAYGLACPENDVTLPDIGRLCDAFTVGGTKCGTLFGEALVIPEHDRIPHLFTIIKQRGALLAKGRIAGLQFDTLFKEGLYLEIGKPAVEAADRIRRALSEKGYVQAFPSPTNQIFLLLDRERAAALAKTVDMSFWEQRDDGQAVMRIVTSWAVRKEDADALIEAL